MMLIQTSSNILVDFLVHILECDL